MSVFKKTRPPKAVRRWTSMGARKNPIPPVWITRHEDGRIINCSNAETMEEAEQKAREVSGAEDIVVT